MSSLPKSPQPKAPASPSAAPKPTSPVQAAPAVAPAPPASPASPAPEHGLPPRQRRSVARRLWLPVGVLFGLAVAGLGWKVVWGSRGAEPYSGPTWTAAS